MPKDNRDNYRYCFNHKYKCKQCKQCKLNYPQEEMRKGGICYVCRNNNRKIKILNEIRYMLKRKMFKNGKN
jgi:hypothetical protein